MQFIFVSSAVQAIMVLQDLEPGQLLGTYNGEVCLQSEYNASRAYDLRRGDNLKDDKTKDLWSGDGRHHFMCALHDDLMQHPLQSMMQASTGKYLSNACRTTEDIKCMKASFNCCAGGGDPAKELIVVSNVAMNCLAFINDPTVGPFIIFGSHER